VATIPISDINTIVTLTKLQREVAQAQAQQAENTTADAAAVRQAEQAFVEALTAIGASVGDTLTFTVGAP
jgi:plastocyanin